MRAQPKKRSIEPMANNSWKDVYGGIEDATPLVVDILRRLDSAAPGSHSQAQIKSALARRLAAEYPGNTEQTTQEHAQNIVAHIHSQWSRHAGLGNEAKHAEIPDPIIFSPQWLADFSVEWGRKPGVGGKWDVFRRPDAADFAGLIAPTADPKKLEERSNSLMQYPLGKPVGERAPKKVVGSPQGSYERRPEVRAWILRQANGMCECCQNEAPFTRTDGSPYLEVHHTVPLAHGGPDTIDNAIAVCPNCHRQLHHGGDRAEALAKVYRQIPRLAAVRR